MLSDKQEKCLEIIYRRMLNEADYLIAHGFHNEAFDAVLQELSFEQSVDFWTREVVNAYQTVRNKIMSSEVVIDGQLVDYLEVIETEDNLKLYASVWERKDNGEIVLTLSLIHI